jgi:hypothetical protein
VRGRDPRDPVENLGLRGTRAGHDAVHVQEHLLGRGQRGVLARAIQLVEDVQALVVEAEHLRRDVQELTRGRFAQVQRCVSTV